MADFSEVMRNMARMCKAYWPDHKDECSADCPLYSTWCLSIETDYPKFYRSGLEMEQVEAAVMKWAAENPEPVYPTWGAWFVERGYLPGGYYHAENPQWLMKTLDNAMNRPIPADIAQKLGIEPKEG